MRLRGGKTASDAVTLMAWLIGTHIRIDEAEPEPETTAGAFWSAQNNGWADAETGVFECMMSDCPVSFGSRDGGRWVGLLGTRVSPERPWPLGRMCEACWPQWGDRPWP